jgi:cell wall-associated NlpC family hydrolase
MDEKEAEQRAAIVREARSWLGTPYHPEARLKGVGADCATMVAEVFAQTGIVPRFEIEHYPHDWHLHRSDELYLSTVLKHSRELPEGELPQAGDVVMYKFGRCYSHGAIVIQWPQIIHSYINLGCILDDGNATWLVSVGEAQGPIKKPRERKFFSCWGK